MRAASDGLSFPRQFGRAIWSGEAAFNYPHLTNVHLQGEIPPIEFMLTRVSFPSDAQVYIRDLPVQDTTPLPDITLVSYVHNRIAGGIFDRGASTVFRTVYIKRYAACFPGESIIQLRRPVLLLTSPCSWVSSRHPTSQNFSPSGRHDDRSRIPSPSHRVRPPIVCIRAWSGPVVDIRHRPPFCARLSPALPSWYTLAQTSSTGLNVVARIIYPFPSFGTLLRPHPQVVGIGRREQPRARKSVQNYARSLSGCRCTHTGHSRACTAVPRSDASGWGRAAWGRRM